MRIKVVLDLNEKKIPINYHSILQGVIYNSLLTSENVSEVHDYGFKFGKRKFKLFTFSDIFGDTEYLNESKELLFKSNGYFEVASYKDELILSLISFLSQNKSIVFNKQIIKVESFTLLDETINNEEKQTYQTISPITTYVTDKNRKTTYFEPNSIEFKESIIQNLSQKFFLLYNENIPNIEITEITDVSKKVIYFRNSFCIAYMCKITFDKLSPKVKKIILSCGLGAKNSSGFGMMKNAYEKKNISI